MKTIIKSNENSILEFAKRSLYSFHVLVAGIAIPFLFLFGISNVSPNKIHENEVKETTVTTHQSLSLAQASNTVNLPLSQASVPKGDS